MSDKIRGVRVPDDLWEAAQVQAGKDGTTVSALIRRYLARYVTRREDRR